MSKLYVPLLALAFVGSSAYGQLAQKAGATRAASKFQDSMVRTPQRPASVGGAREEIWSDDFSNPSNWVAGTLAGANSDTWVIGTEGPTGAFSGPQVGIIASTTAANGFALFDSDAYCGGNQHATLTIANPVDLTGNTSVLLQFEQNYKRYYDNVWVDWSTNGTDWTAIQVNADFGNGGDAEPSANPELTTVLLNGVNGSSTVSFRFRFESTPTSEDPLTGIGYPGDLVGCAYAWMVDDVAITTLPDYNMVMGYAYASTTGQGEEYGRIPAAQLPGTMNIGAELINLGLFEQTNVALEVVFEDAAGNPVPGFSGTIPVGTMPSADTVVADGDINIPPGLPNGLYTATYSITGDNIASDADPTDNELTRNFEVTTDLYSLDAIGNNTDIESLSQEGTSSYTDNPTVLFMTMYTLNTQMTVTGISVALGPASRPGTGAEIEVFLLDTVDVLATPSNISQPIEGVTGTHAITAGDVANRNIGIAFEQPVVLAPGTYYAVARLSGSGTPSTTNSTDPEVFILDDETVPQPGLASALYTPIDFNDDGTEGPRFYGGNGTAYAIRITSLPSVGITEPTELAGISVYPNPTEGQFQITSDRTEVLFVEVTDVSGKIVRTSTFSSIANMDLSSEAAGVYTVTVSSATERSVHRVTVK
jgi:Secretion system C-terminal sorting domain